MRLTIAALAMLMATLLLLSLPNATTAGEGDDPGDVTFDTVEITPDPLVIGEILVIEATISTDLTIDGVEVYYCIDDMCKLPKPMTDEGDGKYSYKIYPEEEGSDEHEFYLTSGQDEAWVKIGVKVGDNTTYWPPKTHERYSEGYFKVKLQEPDTDGDGVADSEDAFPNDINESKDSDNDGVGNNADPDDDNDGYSDDEDAFPEDPTEWLDTDGDGIGDNADTGDGGDHDKEDEDSPGFEAAVFIGAFVAVTAVALASRRRRK
jgi:hypothetical protein